MLRKKYRLGSNQRIKINKSLTTDYFLLRIGENNLLFCRFRFVISKKIDKRAVVRNKIKRMFSNCIKKHLLELKGGYDLIFTIKKSVMNIKEEEICLTIKKTFEIEGMLK